jgi:hypothetical protein
MSVKITPDHLSRAAVVYVRQSTMSRVMGNLESQRRQYDLAQAAEAAGFKSLTVIDDDLGRSGSGSTQRPGFERLVAMVCSGDVGAVYCSEASRLARNGRDWYHLIDLCALASALVRNDHAEYRARFEKLMPVPVIAGQARSVETHHKTCVAKADLGDEFLETMTIHATSTGLAEILVNHLDALGRPPQTNGSIDKAVL